MPTILALLFLAIRATDPKPPWLFTDEERIVARFRAVPLPQPGQTSAYEIDGKLEPHLFMPHELFDILLNGVGNDAQIRARGRAALASGLNGIGFADPDVFWSDLEKIARPYLILKTEPKLQRVELCAARIAALGQARRQFGATKFDQLLYVLIAPDLRLSHATNLPDAEARLRREARGCR